MTGEARTSYRIADDAGQVAQERHRLGHLAGNNDRGTRRLIEQLGVREGWRCLEVGAGSGSVARWLCERVGGTGAVVSVDVDTRFHCELPANGEVRQLDVTREAVGEAAFDLVHARGFLQHIHQREAVLDELVAALRPGGWILLGDGDWSAYQRQPMPEPFRSVSLAALAYSVETHGWDPACGSWLLPALQRRGLVETEARGSVAVMRGGTPSAEWYVAGLARAKAALVAAGVADEQTFDAALAQAREPDFAVLSQLRVSAWGRRA